MGKALSLVLIDPIVYLTALQHRSTVNGRSTCWLLHVQVQVRCELRCRLPCPALPCPEPRAPAPSIPFHLPACLPDDLPAYIFCSTTPSSLPHYCISVRFSIKGATYPRGKSQRPFRDTYKLARRHLASTNSTPIHCTDGRD